MRYISFEMMATSVKEINTSAATNAPKVRRKKANCEVEMV